MSKKRFLNTVFALLLSVFCFTSNAQSHNARNKMTPQYNWDLVIEAIASIESSHNPKAVSKNGLYVGYLQISPILVKECNDILGKQHYTLSDRYSVEKSKEMFIIIQNRYNKQCSVERAIRIWCGGPKGCNSPHATAYYRKVSKTMSQMAKL